MFLRITRENEIILTLLYILSFLHSRGLGQWYVTSKWTFNRALTIWTLELHHPVTVIPVYEDQISLVLLFFSLILIRYLYTYYVDLSLIWLQQV